jgi:ligand-binding sensor domain-containing protein
MRFARMTKCTILLLSTLTTLFSCNGQSHKSADNTSPSQNITLGDTVTEIGKNLGCIFEDRGGNYWFASNGEGAYRYDGKTLIQFTEKDGLCSNFVMSVEEDFYGKLWFSTRDGVCSYDGKTFKNYTEIIKNAPYSRLQYSNKGIFFGHLNGVCFYDGKTFTNFVIHPDNYTPLPNDMNRPYSIYSTVADRAGNVWFGTQSEGVCRYDGKTFTYFKEKDLAGPAVRTLFQDKAGNMWFGNNGGGLFRHDGKTLSNITEEKGLGNPEFLKGTYNDKPGSLARVWSINEDNEGNLWVGTIDAGVWKFDGTNLTNYTTKDGLAGNSIWKIYKDRSGELWFIANGEAICKFNGKTFTRFSFH